MTIQVAQQICTCNFMYKYEPVKALGRVINKQIQKSIETTEGDKGINAITTARVSVCFILQQCAKLMHAICQGRS